VTLVLLGLVLVGLLVGAGPTAASRATDDAPVDCGRGPTGSPESACIEERFAACEPATYVAELSFGQVVIGYRYEILGRREALCAVRTAFVANPNPDYVGKEMTCAFDPAQPFEQAVRDWNTCNGPLLDFMAKVGDPEMEFVIDRGGPRDLVRTGPAGSAGTVTVRRPLRAEYLRREGDTYVVAVEHADNPSCGRQELLLPASKAFRCGAVDHLFVLNPERSDDERLTFVVFESHRG
jgi:hypothetical protein